MGSEQWVAETESRYAPPLVFLSKSAQTIENKGQECEKEVQESSRVRKSMGVKAVARGPGRVTCRANIAYVIILVYELSRVFWLEF